MTNAQKQTKETIREEMSAVERLGLRVSSMINHPIAQTLRKVTIHRLDSDGDREWEEVMSVLAETDELEMVFGDDGSVALSWAAAEDDDRLIVKGDPIEAEAAAPF